jgi:demethylsterigmatocystin 6-O-methyltransferase
VLIEKDQVFSVISCETHQDHSEASLILCFPQENSTRLLVPIMGSITAVNEAGTTMNEAARLRLEDAYRGAADSLETPHDVMLRLFNTVSNRYKQQFRLRLLTRILWQALEIPMVKAGCDLGIFKALIESPKPLSVEQLVEPSGAEPLLLGRILRYLASIRMISETTRDHFHHNNATKALANPSIEGAINYT